MQTNPCSQFVTGHTVTLCRYIGKGKLFALVLIRKLIIKY